MSVSATVRERPVVSGGQYLSIASCIHVIASGQACLDITSSTNIVANLLHIHQLYTCVLLMAGVNLKAPQCPLLVQWYNAKPINYARAHCNQRSQSQPMVSAALYS